MIVVRGVLPVSIAFLKCKIHNLNEMIVRQPMVIEIHLSVNLANIHIGFFPIGWAIFAIIPFRTYYLLKRHAIHLFRGAKFNLFIRERLLVSGEVLGNNG